MQVLQLATIMPMYCETYFHIFSAVKMSTFLRVIHITMVDHLEMRQAICFLNQVGITKLFKRVVYFINVPRPFSGGIGGNK